MEEAHTKPHAVLIPFFYQGHVTPLVNLALKLASKGFTITFVNTKSIHQHITKAINCSKFTIGSEEEEEECYDIFAKARKSGLDIRYKTVSDGFPLSFDRFFNFFQFHEGNIHAFPAYVDELIENLVKTDPSVSCLIADTLFTWTSWIAEKYKLVNVSFWTQPAFVFTLNYHWDLLVENGHFASDDNRVDTIDYIPGVKAIEPKDLTSVFQSTQTTTILHQIMHKAFNDVKNADFIVCNTVQELETDTILALQEKQPFFAVGPIIPFGFTNSLVPTSFRFESDCSHWLNAKPPGSVLYVSFGSCIISTNTDVDEIAHGLSLSKVNFIWVLRPDAVSYEEPYVLPAGFEDEINDRGLVVPWCRQVEVLSNPAVGGFLTHCGWNSMLESLWHGVPLLCFPLMADQPTNKKLVVDDWRAGVNLCDRKPLSRFEVSEKINRLMNGKSAEEVRKATMKVRQTLDNALTTEGSSERSLCQFVSYVKAKISEC